MRCPNAWVNMSVYSDSIHNYNDKLECLFNVHFTELSRFEGFGFKTC